MDKIWNRKSFEVGGHWSLVVVAEMKKTNDHAEPTKVERSKKQKQTEKLFCNSEVH